jgi:transcriptional regulator with XRE-family HTH domain
MPGKRRNFLREWRRKSNRTLEQVADHLHMTHGNLSKIERGKVPWNEDLLDALADLYGCEPVDLLIRDPSDPEGIWSIWDNAKPVERRQIVAIAEAVVKGRAVGE